MNQLSFNRLLVFGLAALSLVVCLYWQTLRAIGEIAMTEDDYSHGVLLPFIALYAVWIERDRFKSVFSRERLASALGSDSFLGTTSWLLVLISGLLIYLLGAASGILHAKWFSFFPVTLALVRLAFGREALALLLFPILLQLMAKPLPDSVVLRIFWPLQVLAARISAWILEVLGVPVYLVGNIIEIPQMRLLVEEACSGMRSVIALLTVALIVGHLFHMRLGAKIILFFCSLAVAIFFNVLRVAMTGILAHFYDPAAASGFFREFSGMIVFVLGLGVVYWISWLLSGPRFVKSRAERGGRT